MPSSDIPRSGPAQAVARCESSRPPERHPGLPQYCSLWVAGALMMPAGRLKIGLQLEKLPHKRPQSEQYCGLPIPAKAHRRLQRTPPGPPAPIGTLTGSPSAGILWSPRRSSGRQPWTFTIRNLRTANKKDGGVGCLGQNQDQQTRMHSIPSRRASFSSLPDMCPTPTAQ